jgi:hypothetical protein
MRRQSAKNKKHLLASNIRFVKRTLPEAMSDSLIAGLRELTCKLSLSLQSGDLVLINGRWYVTHSGLVRLAKRCRCSGIQVEQVRELCDSSKSRYAFRATVYRSSKCRGFVGYGDADPSNVSPLVYGAELRVAETRAVNRALRKAYGIGTCSVEELGSLRAPQQSAREPRTQGPGGNGNGFGGPKVRDRFCQVIRQHQLDPTLVKAYAADFCNVQTLREATREQVENFVMHLGDWAEKDRNALLCQLNRYRSQTEGAA